MSVAAAPRSGERHGGAETVLAAQRPPEAAHRTAPRTPLFLAIVLFLAAFWGGVGYLVWALVA
jgi:nitrate reductase NapE component